MRLNAKALAALLWLAGCSGGGDLPRPPIADTAVRSRDAPAPLPAEAGDARGPAGTSGMGASRYDTVGYASWYGDEFAGSPTASGTPFAPDAITAAHRTLPLGSHAEVTALGSGRTILVLINDRGPTHAEREIDLSRGAAALLGLGGEPTAPVRVRAVTATSSDAAALAAGRPAGLRLSAPPSLLAALRAQLKPAASTATPPLPRRRAPPGAAGYLVQVAAFSSESRARALATTLDGYVEPAGRLHRVRLGPFPDAAVAQRARDDAARRGYGDATIIIQPDQPRVERP
ncbi:septal ring lytic transglycosylase RlpA family protein [Sphingomonas jeddahensis]|uniref:Endolytic peptidoglycan transglycosylase RlpA n=1 Tax=Sphingomonas jeddahensis TaxID=1915074 RepID=A0A1V2EY97_9SPHN|nr:septal ring lytic transglycosylase RlpA family protein [Sphingomonas jeddahensis]ONF97580.1 RlpA-like protein precursor [Sphingomonas jeddahensis]